jgi:hypothetical protein
VAASAAAEDDAERLTDVGNGRRLRGCSATRQVGGPNRGWMVFDGKRWRRM